MAKKLKMKYKTKKTLKNILLGVVCVGAVVGVAAGAKAIADYSEQDTKTIHPTFAIGGLDSNGEYEKSEASIYTEEAFECKGLTIKLDFDHDVTYQVFFYEEDGDFISSTEVLDERYDEEVPTGATHARIEVTPQWTDVEDEDDRKINWFNKYKFANQLNIEVDKEQEVKDTNNSSSVTSSEATA